MADNVMTPEFRVSFPNVFKARAVAEGQDPKFGLTMLFAKGADLSALKKAAQAAAKEKWGDKIPSDLRSPFRDQGEKEYMGYEAGCPFINATSKQRPGIVDANLQDIIEEADFYAGCYARATVRAFAYGGKGTSMRPGVAFGLQNIQKLRDGENLTGRTKPQDDFEAVGDGGSDSGGVFDNDDDIPF